jgi:hypothetical protein
MLQSNTEIWQKKFKFSQKKIKWWHCEREGRKEGRKEVNWGLVFCGEYFGTWKTLLIFLSFLFLEIVVVCF